jgi:hypothetical protein
MLIEHRGQRPVVAASAYVASSAVLCRAVVVGGRARILHGAVVTAEDGEVRIGSDSVVMEKALVKGRAAHPTTVGDAVLIGPHAHVNGATIEGEVFVATGASLFPARRQSRFYGAHADDGILGDGQRSVATRCCVGAQQCAVDREPLAALVVVVASGDASRSVWRTTWRVGAADDRARVDSGRRHRRAWRRGARRGRGRRPVHRDRRGLPAGRPVGARGGPLTFRRMDGGRILLALPLD